MIICNERRVHLCASQITVIRDTSNYARLILLSHIGVEVLSLLKPICFLTFETENKRKYLVIILNN
jgi:hypothetical protein